MFLAYLFLHIRIEHLLKQWSRICHPCRQKRCAREQKPLSPGIPLAKHAAALCYSCSSRDFKTQWRTRVAKIGDRGHPWLTSSFIYNSFQETRFHLKKTSPPSAYRRYVSPDSSGKSLLMISKSSLCETALNMLVRSTKMAVRDGTLFLCGCAMMIFLMDSCMLSMMKSIPFGTPTAKLYGRR